MKNLFAVLGILLLIAAAIVFSLRFRDAAAVKSATVSEQAGNYGDALSGYVKALNALLPGSALPDVNRSKVLVPDAWKKEMAVFCHSLSAPGRPVNKEKRQTILGGILRNAGRVHQHNMLNDPSEKPLSPEQYSAIWNTAFFAPTVAVNPGQQELIDASYATPLSLIKFSALTTYTYDVMLVDTTTNRQTTFTVYPENSTVILARPGTHLCICVSSFRPEPGKIWRSSPTVIPVTVPATPSLASFRIETKIARPGR